MRAPTARATNSVPRGPAPVVAVLDFVERLLEGGHSTDEVANLYTKLVKPWVRTIQIVAVLIALVVAGCLITLILVPHSAAVLAAPAAGALYALTHYIRARRSNRTRRR